MMTTLYRRRQYRDKRHTPVSLADLHMSNQYIAVLCVLAGIGTTLVLLLLVLGQPFADLIISMIFGGSHV